MTIEYASEAERLQLERAVAYAREMMSLGATAAAGTVLDACETFALDAGRNFLRQSVEASAQARADAEKKGRVSVRRGARRVR